MSSELKGALLIDYENVYLAALRHGYHNFSAKQLVEKTIDTATTRMVDAGGRLRYAAVFAPNSAIPEATRDELFSLLPKLTTVEYVRGDKQAADAEMIAKMNELAFGEGYSHFFVAAADSDFIATLRTLKGRDNVCQLWPFSRRQHLRPEASAWEDKEFLDDLLELGEPPPPPPVDELNLFVLCCQRLVEREGRHMWGRPETAIRDLASRIGLLGNEEQVGRLWAQAEGKGLFRKDFVFSGGRERQRRRLAYEEPHVLRLLTLCDAALLEAGSRKYRHGCKQEAVLAALAHPMLAQDQERPELYGLFLKAGYLHESGGLTNLPYANAKFGTVLALRRAAFMVWSNSVWNGEKRNVIKEETFAEHWIRQAVPGGDKNCNDAEKARLRDEGRSLARRAEHCGVFIPAGRTREGEPRYELRHDHPLTKSAKEAACQVIDCLTSMGGEPHATRNEGDAIETLRRYGGTLGRAPAYGSTENEVRAWLSILAAPKHLRWDGREGKITLSGRSPLVGKRLDGTLEVEEAAKV